MNWSSVGGGLPGITSLAPPPSVAALLAHGGKLDACGSFPRAGGLTANGLAQWDGTNWSVFGGGATRGISSPPSVSALAADDEGLCVAGHFKFAGGKPASNFSLWHWPPVLRLERVGSRIIISWHPSIGILQGAPTVNGAWSDVPGPTAVITNDIMQPQQFYRVKL